MIRFILLIIIFLLSLLTVFKAPAYPFWIAAIFISEYGWVWMLAILILIVSGLRAKRYRVAGLYTGCLALIFLARPIVSAYRISQKLPEALSKAFPVSTNQLQPFSIQKMFSKTIVTTYKTLIYSSYSEKETSIIKNLTLDFYFAEKVGNRPCVVVVHGGSWSGGDSRQLPELNSELAKAGYQVASINYRLAPGYHNPAQVEDTRQALNYLKSKAAVLHIDTNQFVLLGRSAGGQIALLAAYNGENAGVKGVIDFYGPADMVWGYSVPANPLVFDSRLIMEKYLGGKYPQIPGKYKASSPVEYISAHTVPTLIIHGGNDVLVAYDHSRRLNDKLNRYHISHYWLQLPWATHGFDYNIKGPGGQLSTYAVLQFMQAVTH